MAFAIDLFNYDLSPAGILLTVATSINIALTCPFIKDEN